MSSMAKCIAVLFAIILFANAIPLVDRQTESFTPMHKRLSNAALIRLIMRNREAELAQNLKRDAKRADLERRSLDDDFSNCFLSPVQCMLPSSRK
ncbi:unnamed protein product [Caenorhabditis bovis]|uniref:Uncharacterized protein n=1 Tax=Caenorhabditis bovis TaxID=2654633 RepID=A0A8S1EIC4_9PELO|nr:unnamed protein product [Caenorhabditis bovis]